MAKPKTWAEVQRARIEIERKAVKRALRSCGWVIRDAAAYLECGETQVRRVLTRHPLLEDEWLQRRPAPWSRKPASKRA